MSGFGLRESHGSTKLVRIVVVGETRTRKSSLIMAAVTDHNHPDPRIPPLLPYTNLPSEYCSEDVLFTLIDTSLRVPIVVAGYSVIQKEHNTIDTKEITTPIRQQCREIEICIEWSAPRLSDISWLAQAVFVQAQIAAMNHIGPVYDQVTNSLKPRCVAALEHIFELNACDNDYILSDDGFNHINARCFSIPLMPSRFRALIKSVQELCPEGVKENSLTVDGFLVLITKLIMDRKLRTLWTMLRTFGYNNDIRLVDEMIPYSSFKRILDQSVELTNEAIGSLRRVYHRFNNLGPQMMESLFETAPARYISFYELFNHRSLFLPHHWFGIHEVNWLFLGLVTDTPTKMMSGFCLGDSHGSTKPVRIVVVGEKGTRKSSLILAAVTGHNHPNPIIPPLLPYTNLRSEYFSEDVPFTLIDTILRPEYKGDVIREVKEADAIVLTFAMDRQESLDRLSEYWLPLFRHLEVRVPIVVAGYIVFYKEHNPIDIEEITTPIRQQCREIEICIEWSAPRLSDIRWLAQAVFVQEQIAAMHPIGPAYDQSVELTDEAIGS
ncbi:hypothetical protein DY000_02047129 [Brassica cretica]|uniref:EF hand associated type-2 domain-containing protein n=2 Tax=Brassica cretica TaxID=69181 RepID=A0ABQ7F6F5_BRACR|nr:hypothetical protein DY000_02047129 [Brassica cretica]